MRLSVLIPTHARPEKIGACVRALSRQTLDPDFFEVVIGLDGPDPEAERAVHDAWPDAPRSVLRVVSFTRRGYIPVRRELLIHARGDAIVSLNDDVLPEPDFLAVHRHEQRLAAARGRPAIVVGSSPWRTPEADTVFDRLVRETSLIFFYDVMDTPEGRADRGRDWGFRHCFGLNFSAPLGAVRQAGGIPEMQFIYGYDDIELAYRLQRLSGRMLVLYRPEAVAEHDHRYTPASVLRREFSLGLAAWSYAHHNPDFTREVFGRDIAAEENIRESVALIQRERAAAERLRKSFLELGTMPASTLGPDRDGALLKRIYQQHLPLKRWTWRRGLVAASRGETSDEFGDPAGVADSPDTLPLRQPHRRARSA